MTQSANPAGPPQVREGPPRSPRLSTRPRPTGARAAEPTLRRDGDDQRSCRPSSEGASRAPPREGSAREAIRGR